MTQEQIAEKEAERWLEQLNNVDSKKDEVSETLITTMVQTSSIVFGLAAIFGTDFVDEFSYSIRLLFFISLILILTSIFIGFSIYLKKIWFWDEMGNRINEVYQHWSKAREGEMPTEVANEKEENLLKGRVTQTSPSQYLIFQILFLAVGIMILLVVFGDILL